MKKNTKQTNKNNNSPERKPVKKLSEYLKIFYDKYLAGESDEEVKAQKLKLLELDKIVEALEEHKKEQEVDTEDTQKKIDLLNKYRDTEPPFNNGQSEDILSLTCYGQISYCCGLSKTCVWRDSVLNLFKISPKDYERIKNECHEKLVEGKIIYDKRK
jgi:carboxypeptidase C (cathepsin A)